MAYVKNLESMLNYGKVLWKKLWIHNPDFGGVSALISSPPRTGKTTLMLKGALKLAELGETVIWRGREVEQIHRLPNWMEKCEFFVHGQDEASFLLVKGRSFKRLAIHYHTYSSAKDIVDLAIPGKINVVFEPAKYRFSPDIVEEIQRKVELDEEGYEKLVNSFHKSSNFWIELGYRLVHRLDDSFWAIFLDEADGVFPSNVRGVQWHVHAWAAEQLRDFGKANISLYMAAHKWSEVDHRMRNKVMAYLYGPAARVPDGSRVNSDATMNLRLGEFIIDWGHFGLVRIKPLPKTEYRLKVRIRPRREK